MIKIVMRGKERARTRLGYYPDLSLAAARNRAKALLLEQRPPLDRKGPRPYCAILKLLLVSAQRFNEVAGMRRDNRKALVSKRPWI